MRRNKTIMLETRVSKLGHVEFSKKGKRMENGRREKIVREKNLLDYQYRKLMSSTSEAKIRKYKLWVSVMKGEYCQNDDDVIVMG